MTKRTEQVVNIRDANSADLVWINERYREIDFLLSTSKDIGVVAEVDGVAAGIGRIVIVAEGQGELGGMYVFDQFKGKGIAKQIVARLQAISPCAKLFCLPFAELKELYAAMGFAPVSLLAEHPPHIVEKYHWCNSHYPKAVVLLVWDRSSTE
ncbi:MAG: GNAT family N-acetyltransferase [Pseudomonadota bacterium]